MRCDYFTVPIKKLYDVSFDAFTFDSGTRRRHDYENFYRRQELQNLRWLW